MTLAGTAFASIRIDLLVGSCAGSLLAAFLASSVPTVVTAFVDIDPTLGGTPLGPPSAVEALLVSRAESFAGAFVLASSVPTVVTAFVDIDPTLGGTPLGPPSAAGALAGPAFFSLLITSCYHPEKSSEKSISPAFQTKPRPSSFAAILWRFLALPDTHTCANTSCYNVYSRIICSLSGLLAYPLFYIIVFLSKYRTKLSKPPEYPLDIPRIP
jgi:hypothetical protein